MVATYEMVGGRVVEVVLQKNTFYIHFRFRGENIAASVNTVALSWSLPANLLAIFALYL